MSEKKIQVTLGNYKGVEVKKAEIIITEEEVKAELERARQYAVTTQSSILSDILTERHLQAETEQISH